MIYQSKKAVKTASLLYPIMTGIGGTVMLAVLLIRIIPKDKISSVSLSLSML